MALVEVAWLSPFTNAKVLVFASPRVSAGIARPPIEEFRFMIADDDFNGGIEFTALWEAAFGPMIPGVAGGVIWVALYCMDPDNTGFLGPPFFASAAVLAA